MQDSKSKFLTLEEMKVIEKWYQNHPLNWIGVWVTKEIKTNDSTN